jgi:hypothetical protein
VGDSGVGDSQEGCRPFHGLDGSPKLTWGSAFGSTPGFMLSPAPQAQIRAVKTGSFIIVISFIDGPKSLSK